jgi:hypothetical protein
MSLHDLCDKKYVIWIFILDMTRNVFVHLLFVYSDILQMATSADQLDVSCRFNWLLHYNEVSTERRNKLSIINSKTSNNEQMLP